MNRGTVKWFNDVKGYGFITDENGNDVFVYYSSIQMEGRKSLNQNDIVEFEIGEDTTGRTQAVNVKRISNNNIMRIIGKDTQKKVYRLLDFSDSPRDIADPWYTGNFDRTYEDSVEGCRALLEKIKQEYDL